MLYTHVRGYKIFILSGFNNDCIVAQDRKRRLFIKNTGQCEVVIRCILSDPCPVPVSERWKLKVSVISSV